MWQTALVSGENPLARSETRQTKGNMSITTICDKNEAAAVDITEHWRSSYGGNNPESFSLFSRTYYVGCVIETWERNGYDDSDFFALVWDWELMMPQTIQYATTRAWTYANGATVDATAEVLAIYTEFIRWGSLLELIAENRDQAATPAPGKVCTVIKGRKIPHGATVLVRRIGEPRKFSPSRWAVATVSALVDVTVAGVISQVWTNVQNLQVINPAQYYLPETAFADKADYCARSLRGHLRASRAAVLARVGALR